MGIQRIFNVRASSQAARPLGTHFLVIRAHPCVGLRHAFLDMLNLPALHIQVSVHSLIEQEGAIASLSLSEFVEGGDFSPQAGRR